MSLDSLSAAQWYAAISAAIRDSNIKAAAEMIALMAIHGYAAEAEELRWMIALLPGADA